MNISDLKAARVIAQYRGKYRVKSEHNEFWAEITGKMMFAAGSPTDYPVVGDEVEIYQMSDDQAIIHKILPRKSLLQRKSAGKDELQPIAANIDVAFVVQAVDRDFNLNRFERYLTIINAGKIKPMIILNKIDLVPEEDLAKKVDQIKARFKDVTVETLSAAQSTGIEELKRAIEHGKIYCFVGSSGVGKSSIINKLLGQELLKTKMISASTKKGKHVTTHRELFVLDNGGMVIDNPGIREVGVGDVSGAVDNVFGDISELAKHCKFDDCTHDHEPGCAVRAAVKDGRISKEQYNSFMKLKKEADYYAMSALEKRRKDRSFGRMVKNVIKVKGKKGK
ncbi:MAG: ribosome small subunit-dependent GTPase A [Candidatus Margulisbacteria bacterium]|nr:ribosome small subunit-dependent GTPase A [Candidatus Margulisiibacteriota bacterium]